MEEQKINKKITFSIVAVLLIVLITIGATYAYFSAQGTTGTQTVTTGTLTMNFDKAGSVVTINGITPIDDSEIKTKAAAFPFSITNTGTAHMNITIKLKDIVIADDLKDIDFRWGLYNADTNKGISFGIFKHASNGGEEILYRDSIIDAGSAAKNYVLRIWIHDDGDNQNYMQGETFSAKIDVTGTPIEYTDEDCFAVSGGSIHDYDDPYSTENLPDNCPTDIVVPREINGVAITGLGGNWSNGITSLIIPDSVNSVDLESSGSHIEHITLPENINSFGLYGNSVSTVFLPENNVVLSPDLNLSGYNDQIVIPGNYSLSDNSIGASDVVLMDGITQLERGNFSPFAGGSGTLEIPSSVTTINDFVLADSGFSQIVVRGRTEAPSGFGENWNCITQTGSDTCGEYIPVTYRP